MTQAIVRKKICLLGGFAVGKTSLIARFVSGIFSERYLTTVGVKIDKRSLQISERALDLMIWDVNGEDQFQRIHPSYLRGMNGFLLVIDGTRAVTLGVAETVFASIQSQFENVPGLVLVNKHDLEPHWEIRAEQLEGFKQQGIGVRYTSAKSGAGIEEAFLELGQLMLANQGGVVGGDTE